MRDLVPFLMFCGDQHGKAEEAVNWYCSIFPDSRIVRLDRYGPGEGQPQGTVRMVSFELGGKPDEGHRQRRSPPVHLHPGHLDLGRVFLFR